MSNLKTINRTHTQLIEQHHSHKRMIASMMDHNDRKSAEARARFERPAWHQVVMQKFNKEEG